MCRVLEGLNGYDSLDQALMDNINAYCSLLGIVNTEKVYGLDINPRAIKVAWLNLFLNALDENGDPIYDSENKTLLDKVEFYESDLLSYCMDNKIELDCIVGASSVFMISQILNPNPEAMSKMITENASEEFLYSLSNYCALQGFVEDQFGLGLIARAAEEGIAVIKPTGIMVFNIGGRPGQGVCKRLFERRGFQITKLWQTKVIQAADTDISSLVEIENDSPHRFEFFMGLVGNQPICARTAWAYGLAGGCFSHSLSVYSCQPATSSGVHFFHDSVSNSLDLSFDDDSVADEKIPFLAYLSSVLKEISSFPYDPPAGNMHFRKLITRFMKIYHHIPLSVDLQGGSVDDVHVVGYAADSAASLGFHRFGSHLRRCRMESAEVGCLGGRDYIREELVKAKGLQQRSGFWA
ncbi:hypothetical protein HPP92_001968 [Vanilla planifolia]|uniref:Uncharacterized protein n=1 Tax=Vanilla planifolia TaxID=51239 RepID=A0A835S4E5_VANPL|nr:hypothetical protein HPP92_001968 [Vanilla planifolia]